MNTFARTALLSLALATVGFVPEAAAQSLLSQWLSHMPVNGGVQRVDQNRDGRAELIIYDVNRDGRIDAFRVDSNNDGYLDVVMLDTNYDGLIDEIHFDTNRSGVLDRVYGRDRNTGQFTWVAYALSNGNYSGWNAVAQNSRDTRSGTMTIGGQGQGWSVEAHDSPSSMTIGGGQNRGGTGNLQIDRMMFEHNNAMIRTWLGPYVIIR